VRPPPNPGTPVAGASASPRIGMHQPQVQINGQQVQMTQAVG
jgi:hypothetical protein